MTLTNNDYNNQEREYKIDMATGRGGAWVTRTFPLKSGENVSINVKIETSSELTLKDIHEKSIERAIYILQSFLDISRQPKPAIEAAPTRQIPI